MKYHSDKHVGVLIGRFQPLHLGHIHILKDAMENGITSFKIFIGSANSGRTLKNPFLYEERKTMLTYAFQEMLGDYELVRKSILRFVKADIEILPLNDYIYNDLKWALEFNTKLDSVVYRNKKPVLLGFNKDDSSYYLNMFPELDSHILDAPYAPSLDHWIHGRELNATSLRDVMFLSKPDEGTFLEDKERMFGLAESRSPLAEYVGLGVMRFLSEFYKEDKAAFVYLNEEYNYIQRYRQDWSGSPYAATFVTVDALVIQDNNILLIKRKNAPGRDTWALPGGFIGQKERLVDGAIRELREETGLKVPEQVIRGSIKEVKVVDNPFRSERGRVLTHCYYIHLASGFKELPHIRGNSDAKQAKWFPIHKVAQMKPEMFEDHWDIIDTIVGF